MKARQVLASDYLIATCLLYNCSYQDRWDFLDKRKLVPNEPLTKAKYLKRSNAAKLDKSQDIARSPKVSMEKVKINNIILTYPFTLFLYGFTTSS